MGALAVAASAQDQAHTISGIVEQTPATLPAPFGDVEVGAEWTLEYCVDPSTADGDPSAEVGIYLDAITHLVVTVDGVSQVALLDGANLIRVENDFASGILTTDRYLVSFELPGAVVGQLNAFTTAVGLGTVPPLQSDALPACGSLSGFSIEPTLRLFTPQGPAGLEGEGQEEPCGPCIMPECLLVIGGPGAGATVTALGHQFTTQIGAVEQAWSVWLDDIPEFVIWEPPASVRTSVVGLGGGGAQPLGAAVSGKGQAVSLADDPPPQVFYAQVLMWNPQVFPSNPEQSTHGLAVTVMPNGRVFTVPYGASDGGMTLWAETGWNEQGQKILRLPFSIPGF